MTDTKGAFTALETPKTSSHPIPIDETTQAGTADVANATAKVVPLAKFFSFADSVDLLLMVVGTLSGVAIGISQPIQMVLFGDVSNAFNPTVPVPPDEFRASVNKVARNFAIVGAAVVVSGFLQVACWSMTASRQIKRIRSAYVRAILSKELGWFDINEPMQLAPRVAESAVAIQNGMGRKFGEVISYTSMAISGIVIAVVKGWELTLVLLAFTPIIAVAGFFATKAFSSATQAGIDAYGRAGAIAQESLSNPRTVHMFNAIEHFTEKYADSLQLSAAAGIKKGFAVGWGMGLMFFTIFCTYAAGLYYGTLKIANNRRDGCTDNCYDGGRVVTVFFSTLIGAMALGQIGPNMEAVIAGRAAACHVFAVIESGSQIDPLSQIGLKPNHVHGKIELDRVSFAYPSRPDVPVCSNYSLTIHPGETVALVGPSGSGKSTIVSLLERFYDPQSGSVKLDGVDVRELNVKWLREQIGLVGQEPALFATSIMENIRHGCSSATDEQVIEAAKMANAYSFIKEFPEGFATEVGERGTQLSGGQKQRIAIARAIIKNPRILLLDEATSALDAESERIVQQSLDALLASSTTTRTTIIVAHRLSTIRNADKIAVHSNGEIVELGTHDQLMKDANGLYHRLVDAQNAGTNGHDTVTMPNGCSSSSSWLTKYTDQDNELGMKQLCADMGESDTVESGGGASEVPVQRLWQLSLPEWKFLFAGGIGAIIHAAVFPFWGVLMIKMVALFFEDKPRDDLLRNAQKWALCFVGLGVIFGLSVITQHYGFAVVSQRLVSRIRLAAFTSMLRQEIGWFDRKENASGALVTRLSTDAALLQAMTSDSLNQGLVSFTSIALGFGIAFYSSWEMTLVLLATAPLFLFASTMDATMMSGSASAKKNNDADVAAGFLLVEVVGSIRTVASLGLENKLNETYGDLLQASKKADARQGLLGGVAFGASQSVMFFNVSLMFYVGGKWVSSGRITFEEMFRVIMVIMLSMMAVGMATQAMADQAKVKLAARRVFQIIDRSPQIDATSQDGELLARVLGNLQFDQVAFAYPSRPDAHVYKNYSLSIGSGETVALVGASGSGKSTAIALLERFYDPAAGSVTLDGVDLRNLSLPWLRERISLVSQEPVLFAGTIAENIAMGKPGATRLEIEDAAKKANAYDFIMQFPDGFDTEVGDRGAQVSGGQKQRIAIARAILRDPEVLLLDEATSALDNESERVVQASLDVLLAEKKRTTVIVAHRLSTIRHADRIAVVENGAIVEQGTHDHLMQLTNGVYRALVSRQLGH